MKGETKLKLGKTHHYLYLVDSRLGLAKPGVAPDPEQRLRELQVGSPVRLRLALAVPYPTRAEARAVLAALARQFAYRRAHGSWFRVTIAEVRRALEHPAPREAAARAAGRRSAQRADPPGPAPRRSPRSRTEKELAYQRRRRRERGAKQRQAARLLARGRRQVEVASALGVTARTLRNWGSAPVFVRALERELARHGRERAEAAPAAERVPPRARRPRAAAATAPAAATEAPELPPKRRPRQASGAGSARRGVPLFPATAEGRAERLAYYEVRKLSDLPQSLLDYNDVIRGRETPAERRVRGGRAGEGRASRR